MMKGDEEDYLSDGLPDDEKESTSFNMSIKAINGNNVKSQLPVFGEPNLN
jgi:hypothetical protein